jgi:hypothetical protein
MWEAMYSMAPFLVAIDDFPAWQRVLHSNYYDPIETLGIHLLYIWVKTVELSGIMFNLNSTLTLTFSG